MTKKNKSNLIWPTDYAGGADAKPIPIMILTGEPSSGKTQFALSIDPVPVGEEPKTIIFDFEAGSSTYEANYSITRLNMPHLLRNGAEKDAAAEWAVFHKLVEEHVYNGRYTVMVIDTASSLQDMAFAYVQRNYKTFGITSSSMTQMIWAATKTLIRDTLTQITEHVQTLVLILHLKNVYDKTAQRSTGKRTMEGLDVYTKLATLILWLERNNKTVTINGKKYPASPHYPIPSGVVIKQRLTYVDFQNTDEYGDPKQVPLFPDRIPRCTPGFMKHLMSTPLDSTDRTEEYQMPEGVGEQRLSNEEKEIVQSELYKNKVEALKLEQEIKYAEKLERAKRDMADRLIEGSYYSSITEIKETILELGLTDKVNSLSTISGAEAELIRHAAK